MPLASPITFMSRVTQVFGALVGAAPVARHLIPVTFSLLLVVRGRDTRSDIYNILWAVVFGFATLNILSLAARRSEPGQRGLSFGELLAVMVVLISMFLLGWEMLNLFHIFPIRLKR